VKRRDFIRQITQAGWVLVSEDGPHAKYRKRGCPFAVPRGREISPGVVRAWEKLNRELDEEDE
jgi:predicted RNA binding protein YcfA (HicA-like mRNA interferase family)